MAPVANLQSKSGFKIPYLGLGTWQAPKDEVREAVATAIDIGYRHIDCASLYGNEEGVGEAISAKLADGTISRRGLFVTSKLWGTDQDPKDVRPACLQSLQKLQLDYLDLYLVHLPMGLAHGDQPIPMDAGGKLMATNVDYVETWKAMESLVDEGLCKAIGISNFNSKQIDRLLRSCRIRPVNLQIESSPYLANQQLIDFAHSRGITVTAYSPLGSPTRPWAKPDDPKLLEEPLLRSLAARHRKTVAQILIRFQMDRGVAVVPKSAKESRIRENFDVLNFALTRSEIDQIVTLNNNFRAVPWSMMADHPHYPFKQEF